MKRSVIKQHAVPAAAFIKPEPPLREKFLDTANDRVILQYFQKVRQQFLYANNFGLALDDNDLDVHDKPVLLDNLFVPPFLSESYLSPATVADAEEEQSLPQLYEVYHLVREKHRLFILGDPGAGKTTLISWLMLALSYSGENHVKGALGNLVPFAFILRDLDLHGVEIWDDLEQAFLHKNETTRPHQETMQRLLESGQALFLIDGIDEISEPSLRSGLGKALLDGMNRFPRCRFIFTSRLIGFSLADFFNLPPATTSLAELAHIAAKTKEELVDHEEVIVTSTSNDIPISYLAPFTLSQVRRFVTNWYGQYEPNTSLHAARVKDLMDRLGQNDGLGHLCRIPVLLNMICFIHARRLRLPDGRAELYGRIAETYLVALDRARGLRFQGRELGVDYHDLGHWLSQLALHMQERRGTEDDTVLATREEVEGILRKGFEEKGLSTQDARAQGMFILEYIAQRSGFLIPRGRVQGQEVYAFNHLSFQEYFTAQALNEELMFMEKARWETLRQDLSKPQWREPFILLFELLPTVRKADHLADKLFGRRHEHLKAQEESALHPGCFVLAHVAMDTAVRLGSKKRSDMITQAWRSLLLSHVGARPKKNVFYGQTRRKYPDAVVDALWREQFASLEIFKKLAPKHTVLRFHGKQFRDLAPLAALTRLKTLDLSDTQVSDLAPLAALTQLEELALSNTQVSDLAPLVALTRLKTLDLSNTQVSDLAPLAALTRLKTLDLENTQINKLTPLARLAQLKSLSLTNTQVSDLTPLVGLTQLEIIILHNTQVSDLTPLVGLTQLKSLFLHGTQVSDLTPLAAMTQLEWLILRNTQVSDLTPLVGLTQLETLDLTNTKINDLTPLAALVQLEWLVLNDTEVSDLTPLVGLTQLAWLNLTNTQVSDLTPLANLTRLSALTFHNIPVNDLAPLASLTQLETLDLSNTQVSDLAALANLTQIRRLDLSNTQVSDLTPLANLTKIEELDLSNTQVSDLAALANLAKIEELNLSNTQVSDIACLDEKVNVTGFHAKKEWAITPTASR